MQKCFLKHSKEGIIPITIFNAGDFSNLTGKFSEQIRNWLRANGFKAIPGEHCLIPDKNGNLERVILCVADTDDFWQIAKLPDLLAAGNYRFADLGWNAQQLQRAVLAWALGSYKFDRYKNFESSKAKLALPEGVDSKYLENVIEANYRLNDIVNMPDEDFDPEELAEEALGLAKRFKAKFRVIAGEKLLKEKCGGIHAVGKGSSRVPRLIDLRWDKKKNAPMITLVGKGVCFDSGGYNIKSSEGMLTMKKDMSGAAHALALAQMIMQADLPVSLRVIIPAVENLVSGNSFKVGDIICARNGKTIEVTDTDAEGRLILADALALASEDQPDLLLDFATLTGAIHVALGIEITGMFTDDDILADDLIASTRQEQEPLWRMPLYHPYSGYLKSEIADIRNYPTGLRYGGAITAALFLKEFVAPGIRWVHFDLANADGKSRGNRPKSGQAFCLRGIFDHLSKKFNNLK